MEGESDGYQVEFRQVALDLLSYAVTSRDLVSSQADRHCLGRHLCRMGREGGRGGLEALAGKIVSFCLLWVGLDDTSQAFVTFLDNVTEDDFDETLDCDLLFYECDN